MTDSPAAASVHQRLLNLARASHQEFNSLLTRYANERLLYRLSRSKHADNFILKGAALYYSWTEQAQRPTRDLDFAATGDPSDRRLLDAFSEFLIEEVEDDGLRFDPSTLRIDTIRADQEYEGKRVRLTAYLGRASIRLRVDLGFGDVITPRIEKISYPTLLGHPSPRLNAYPKETVIAEKLEAIVRLGAINSRYKDYFDLWNLANILEFDRKLLAQAIKKTFDRRGSGLPEGVPVGLSAEFASEKAREQQWQAFLARTELEVSVSFAEVVDGIRDFYGPALELARAKSGGGGVQRE